MLEASNVLLQPKQAGSGAVCNDVSSINEPY